MYPDPSPFAKGRFLRDPPNTLALWRVTHGFDVVAVGVEHEGAVVAGVVVRARTGRAIVPTARLESSTIEGVHLPLACH
jgi:hypothetical protein